jgi:DsbC/DsbD-like thiol-disulfide interchange protein
MAIGTRVLAIVAVGISLAACAREAPPSAKGPQPVAWAAEVGSRKTLPDGGALIDVRLQANIENGWHVYSLTQKGGGPTPLSVKVDPASLLSIDSSVIGPTPEKAMDPNFGVETETYSGAPVITVPVKVSAEALKSGKPVEVKVRSQACSDKLCLPAKTTTLSVTIPKDKT